MWKRRIVIEGSRRIELEFDEDAPRPFKRPWYAWMIDRLSWLVTGIAIMQYLTVSGIVK